MGEARAVMDRLTESLTTNQDLKVVADLFAADAVAITPDDGELHGREAIVAYWRTMTESVPDATFTPSASFEFGDTAIDEGLYSGRNTGPIQLPTGETLPATGKEIRLRGVDFAQVKDGRIVSYRLYFDQMEFLGQLGLLPEELA
ncbi:nuclear transport factor 2 family protein [Streptomyces sp. ms191]|uniref:ester cyclase n=1 Tax=unclassified Streptomyces TaxID=2593676 RepID=UPI0011CDEBEF|nr:nuclear transport factor 2 family protein [Streptomyces sp. ms191]TXS20885.1 nuclear transport factor 2 family protein [Streptomyces sp. ms191]